MSWLQTMANKIIEQNPFSIGEIIFLYNLFRQGVFQVPKIGEKILEDGEDVDNIGSLQPNSDTSKRSIDSTAPEAPFDDSSSIAQANPPTSPHMEIPVVTVVWRRIPIWQFVSRILVFKILQAVG